MTSDCTSASDIQNKRAAFISRQYSLNQEFAFASHENKLEMCRLYNTAFYGSNCWDFTSDEFERFGRSWNSNLRIMFDLPRDTHCWIVEELSDGRHFKQMVFSRFTKYLELLATNKKPFIRCLYDLVSNDVSTLTGSNIRKLFLTTKIDPRYFAKNALKNWRVYEAADGWTMPLIKSLLWLKEEEWEVIFNDEDNLDSLKVEDIDFMIDSLCRD